MIVSIMQPTFLPWLGYFHLMVKSDLFILLDDVQFEKRSWQQRNKFIISQKASFLTIPVNSKNKFNQKINEVLIDNTQTWKEKHLKTFQHNYGKHKFFKEIFELITNAYNKDFKTLLELNSFLILSIKEYLSIKTKIVLSSQFSISTRKENRLLDLLQINRAKKYLSPIGSKEYLGEGNILKKKNIELEYINYQCRPYMQKSNKKFIDHLSIIDALFNLGLGTKNIIK
jgi:hypothetical protein